MKDEFSKLFASITRLWESVDASIWVGRDMVFGLRDPQCANQTFSRIHALAKPNCAWHRLGESVERFVA